MNEQTVACRLNSALETKLIELRRNLACQELASNEGHVKP